MDISAQSRSRPFRPMLAAKTPSKLEDFKVHLPLLASYKVDGIRGLIRNNKMVSRSLKTIPSAAAQDLALIPQLQDFDGELISSEGPQNTYSAVMTHGSRAPIKYLVFDWCDPAKKHVPYSARLGYLRHALKQVDAEALQVYILEQRLLFTIEDIVEYEAQALDLGYEGLILRKAEGHYKWGRSTFKEGTLLKLVRYETDEAEVIGYEELVKNENQATISLVGSTTRAKLLQGLIPMNCLGALIVKDSKGREFRIGTGFTQFQRTEIWRHQSKYLGRLVKFSYKPYGEKMLPRHPSFLGWRHPIDLD